VNGRRRRPWDVIMNVASATAMDWVRHAIVITHSAA
jgi:hypothetical protein